MQNFLDILLYPFVLRALIAGGMIALCSAMLGVILVLKRCALIGHGLSEIAFASLSAASALSSLSGFSGLSGFSVPPLLIAAPIVILSSFVIFFSGINKKTGGDIAIAAISSFALASGVAITALSSGFNSNSYGYMFGSVLALNDGDVLLASGLSIFIILIFIIFFNRLFIITYNEEYARSLGLNTLFYEILISLITALAVLTGMRIMGALLISGIMIFPALTARRLVSGFKKIMVIAALISLLCYFAGLLISFIWNLPAGASVIIANAVAFCSVYCLKKITGIFPLLCADREVL